MVQTCFQWLCGVLPTYSREDFNDRKWETLHSLEKQAVLKHGPDPFRMACLDIAFDMGFTSINKTSLVRGQMVAAMLLLCTFIIGARLVGIFGCTSHMFNVSSMRCIDVNITVA